MASAACDPGRVFYTEVAAAGAGWPLVGMRVFSVTNDDRLSA
ncbi:MAG: hypothetical protein AB7V26_09445 [Lysobacterales bacterium]